MNLIKLKQKHTHKTKNITDILPLGSISNKNKILKKKKERQSCFNYFLLLFATKLIYELNKKSA